VTVVVDRVSSSYLGFPLEITDTGVRVTDKRGRLLVTVAEISSARRFIRGYRRIPSNVEPTALTRMVTAGSLSEGA
jgi:hypothetical protein